MSMITMKIKYTTENVERIIEMIKNYNSIFGLVYNYAFDNHTLSTKELIKFLKTKEHIFLDTYFRNGAIYDVKSEFKKQKEKKIIFGGKKLFLLRQNHKITKEEYKLRKLRPLQVVGASHDKGNGKFQILNENEILFKPSRKEHFILKLGNVGKNYTNKLKVLITLQNQCLIPITYKLGLEYIYISFENNLLQLPIKTPQKKDRIFSIDLNPNYVGYTVIDWKHRNKYKIIAVGVFSLKDLNDYENSLKVASNNEKSLYVTNKRKHEVIQITYKLCSLAKHYHCQMFAMEDLNIKSSDKGKGKNYNKLCNKQWNRNMFVNIITKLTDLYDIRLQKVKANYSSFMGNLVYRNERLPDMCLAAIEIGRRAYEFYHQYVLEDKEKEKNIIFNKLKIVRSNIMQSLEELDCVIAFNSLLELYKKLKEMKCKYRFSMNDALKYHYSSLSKNVKSYTTYYIFI